jgi:hypothetical protein
VISGQKQSQHNDQIRRVTFSSEIEIRTQIASYHFPDGRYAAVHIEEVAGQQCMVPCAGAYAQDQFVRGKSRKFSALSDCDHWVPTDVFFGAT